MNILFGKAEEQYSKGKIFLTDETLDKIKKWLKK